jgi:hypothetical protein
LDRRENRTSLLREETGHPAGTWAPRHISQNGSKCLFVKDLVVTNHRGSAGRHIA